MKASLTWDSAVGAYRLTFNIHWKREKPQALTLIKILKENIPASDRDYDPDTYTWYIHERWLDKLKLLVNAACSEVTFVEKPEGQEFQQEFHPVEQDLSILAQILAQNEAALKSMQFSEAKKLYRRKAMELHPDRNPAGADAMAQLNEIWARVSPKVWKQAGA